NLETAQSYLEGGDYFWNSGMFLFKAKSFIEELRTHRPDILEICEMARQSRTVDEDFIRVDKECFSTCSSVSIDFAVMEKTSSAVMVQMDAGWSDVGSWSALLDLRKKDINGNSVKGDVRSYATTNSLIQADNK